MPSSFNKVSSIEDARRIQNRPLGPALAGSGEPPHDGGMDGFDQRLKTVEQDVAVIKATMATKADVLALKVDVAALETRLIKWFVGTAVVLAGIAFTAAKFIH